MTWVHPRNFDHPSSIIIHLSKHIHDEHRTQSERDQCWKSSGGSSFTRNKSILEMFTKSLGFLVMWQVICARSFSTNGITTSFAALRRHSHRLAASSASRAFRGRLFTSEGSEDTGTVTSASDLEEYSNESNIRDQVFSAISADGSVKVTACTARNLVNDLMIAHTMTATPADALGRTIVCALMMSNGMQDEQTVQLTMNCKCQSAVPRSRISTLRPETARGARNGFSRCF